MYIYIYLDLPFVCKMCAFSPQKINQKAEILHIWKIRVYQTYGYYAVTLGCYLVGVTSVTRCRLGPGEGPETPDFSIEVQCGGSYGQQQWQQPTIWWWQLKHFGNFHLPKSWGKMSETPQFDTCEKSPTNKRKKVPVNLL